MDEISACFSNSKIPSQENNQPWIYVSSPLRPAVESSEDTSCTIGKWLLFHDTQVDAKEGLSPHDSTWQFIRTLVMNSEDTGIISAKCSTNWQGQYAGGASAKGVICCYTADYRDKQNVKKAGDAIRKACVYPCNLFYKTDNATYAGAYRQCGNKAVSMYKHSLDSRLYERDSKTSKWLLVNI